MKLDRLTERVWILPYEEERDRPNLGYIRGDRWSLAVDAGHSAAHTMAFYTALEEAGLPLPALTILTHWHWDHTFGMHAAQGLCAANARTQAHLAEVRGRLAREGEAFFLSIDERVRREYRDGQPVVVTLADLVFDDRLQLDPGGCSVHAFRAEAPHTDDSTLVHVPGEDVLFLGDAACGALPGWEKDPALCGALAGTVAALGAGTVLEGHWRPQTREEILRDLREDAGVQECKIDTAAREKL